MLAILAIMGIVVGLGFLSVLFTGWAFMLMVGIIHHEWIHQCPTIGYGWAVAISGLLSMMFGPMLYSKNS